MLRDIAIEAGQATGVELIEAERWRQIDKEGWTTAHDDEHEFGELASAAACYALPPMLRVNEKREVFRPEDRVHARGMVPTYWPCDWTIDSWKPTPNDRVRELVKAGALLAAEIDRLQRRAGK